MTSRAGAWQAITPNAIRWCRSSTMPSRARCRLRSRSRCGCGWPRRPVAEVEPALAQPRAATPLQPAAAALARTATTPWDLSGRGLPGTDTVIEEVPVALVYNGISHAVMLASPGDLED